MSNASIPRPALLLGAAGLLPSLAMPPLLAAGGDAAAFALQAGPAYGALIASFIGGAWWGLAANKAEGAALTRWLAASVLPMLVAWVALLLPPRLAPPPTPPPTRWPTPRPPSQPCRWAPDHGPWPCPTPLP